MTFDNNYFNALYQGIQIGGYTKLIENILGNIEVMMNCDYLEHREELNKTSKKIVFTGPIDAYLNINSEFWSTDLLGLKMRYLIFKIYMVMQLLIIQTERTPYGPV